MYSFQKKNIAILGFALLFAVNAFLPTQLLVYCEGHDGHSGVELAHADSACHEVKSAHTHQHEEKEVSCCAHEEEEVHADEHGCKVNCAEQCCSDESHCEDTELSTLAATLKTSESSKVFVQAAVVKSLPLILTQVSSSKIDTSYRVENISPPLESTSVLRL